MNSANNGPPFEQLSRLHAKIEQLETRVVALEAKGRPAAANGNGTAQKPGAIADDRDLDSAHGDPEVYRDPSEKYWTGESYKHRKYSVCPVPYLHALANYLEACAFMSEKDGNTQRAGYQRKDAARARGWAKRNGTGTPPPPHVMGRREYGKGNGTRATAPSPRNEDTGYGTGSVARPPAREAPPAPPPEPEPPEDTGYSGGDDEIPF